MKGKKLIAFCLALALMLSLVACGNTPGETESTQPGAEGTGNAENGETIRVGFLYPLSGSNADSGQNDYDAAVMAVEDINNAGGIMGKQVELIVEDCTSDAAQSKSACERLIAQNVCAIVGCGISALTLPIMPSIEKAGIPLITICMSPELVDSGYQYIFQAAPETEANGVVVTQFLDFLNAELGLGLQKVGCIYENSAWGIGANDGFEENIAGAEGFEIVYSESFPAGFTDASSIVTSLKASGAEVVFITAYTQEAKLLVSTMEALDYHPLIIGGGGGFAWPSLGEDMGEDVNGIITVGTSNWSTVINDYSTELAERFEEKFGYFMTEHSVPTYNCYSLLFQAIDIAQSDDPDAIAQALRDTEFTEKVNIQPGKVKFDETGRNIYAYSIMMQWQDGKPRTIFPAEVASDELMW